MKAAQLAPILVKREDIVNVQRGAYLIGKSEKTVRRWFNEYALGRQSSRNAPLEISLPGLHMVAAGDMAALEELRAGNRAHPSVVRYLEFLGLRG